MDNNAMDILREAGFDVEGALGRLMNNPAFYAKMLGKFLQDTNFEKLRAAVEAGDLQAAGESAHALKGVSSTLGMVKLSDYCATMQFLYQGREEGDPAPVFAEAAQEYERVMAALQRALA